MTNWAEKLRLKGKAEEDIFFAKRDRELLDALHKRKAEKQNLPEQREREKAAKH